MNRTGDLDETTPLITRQASAEDLAERSSFDDNVTIQFRTLSHLWLGVSLSWLLGITIAISPQVFSDTSVRLKSVLSILGYFCIISSCVCGFVSCYVLGRRLVRRTAFLSTEDRADIESIGIHSAPEHILYESFPMLRHLFILLIASSIIFASLALSQTLCLFWCRRGLQWIFKSCIPLIILGFVMVTSVVLIKSIPLAPAFSFIAVMSELMALLIKFETGIPLISWTHIFIPFNMFLLICTMDLLFYILHYLRVDLGVTVNHKQLARATILTAAIIIGFVSTFEIIKESESSSPKSKSWGLFLLSVWLFYGLAISSMGAFIKKQILSRGYLVPLKIQLTQNGWEAVPEAKFQRENFMLI